MALAEWTNRVEESEIRRLLRVKTKYYMAGGVPGNIPVMAFRRILQEVTEDMKEKRIGRKILGYGPSEGLYSLRKVLQERLWRTENVRGDVIISSGSQQTIYAILKTVANEGDVIIAPEPTYLGFLGPCKILGLRVITVKISEEGVIVDDLESALKDSLVRFHRKPVAIYFPSFADNPSGNSPSWGNKVSVYNFARSNDILIIEDNAYKEITFESEKAIPMKSLDKENESVVYMCTTSKEAAVLRLGYSVMPEHISENFVKLKGFLDLCTSSLTQMVAERYYRNHIDEEIKKIRQQYKVQRDAMIHAVDECIGGERSNPKGGFFVWTDLGVKDSKKILPSIIKSCNISYVPGETFMNKKRQTGFIRLSYSALDPKNIEEGIKELGKFVQRL